MILIGVPETTAQDEALALAQSRSDITSYIVTLSLILVGSPSRLFMISSGRASRRTRREGFRIDRTGFGRPDQKPLLVLMNI